MDHPGSEGGYRSEGTRGRSRPDGPALAGPPLQLRVAPDPHTRSLTYTVTNAGSTATRASVEFAAGVAGVAVTTQQGTTCTPNAQGMICDLGTLAPQDTVPIVLQEPSGQGAMNVPQACLDVPTASGPGARGCLAATTLDQAALSRLPSTGPSGIQPFANLADSLRLFVNPGAVTPPAPASARPGSPAPRGGTPSPEPEREVTVPFTNPSSTPVSMSLTLQVLDSQGAPLTVVRAQALQGAVHQGTPSGVPGPAPASGLTWDTGSVPPRGTATLRLFVEVGQGGPLRVAGRFVARSADGKASGQRRARIAM